MGLLEELAKRAQAQAKEKEQKGGTLYDPETKQVVYKETGRPAEDQSEGNTEFRDDYYGRGRGNLGR